MTFQMLPNATKKQSDIWILPLGFEMTVCGKSGTKKMPKEIIKASMDIEFYEEEYNWSPFKYMKLFSYTDYKKIDSFEKLQKKIDKCLNDRKDQLILTLGGEHSISPFVIKKLLSKKSTIIFYDAHGDFRKQYHESQNNHACALYNLAKLGHKIITIGQRSFFDDEKERMKKMNVEIFSDFDLQKKNKQKELFKALKKVSGDVYISVDLDCFDPSLASGVGTPLPGGIGWFFFLKSLKKIFKNKNANVIGCDIVEGIPESSKVTAILAAKIMQKIFSYWGKTKGFDKRAKNGSQMQVEFE